jgi:hypothetical protein
MVLTHIHQLYSYDLSPRPGQTDSYLFVSVIIMHDVFFFTLEKIFRPIKIIFDYKFNIMKTDS